MRNRRTVIAGAVGALVVTGMASGAIASSPEGTAARPAGCERPLDILLTNDDGYAAAGINAVHQALKGAGHHVTMVAPLTNQTGKGGSLAYGGTLAVTQPVPGDSDIYAVAGSPADSVAFGLHVIYADGAPDLVVSGTNAGTNLSRTINHSGTVGAAITAVDRDVPAIAVSTAHPAEFDPAWDGTTSEDFAGTAVFVRHLVATLRGTAPTCASILPDGLGLNVNYPSAPFQGARAATLADHESIPTTYTQLSPGQYKVGYSLSPMQDAAQDTDATTSVDYDLVAHGYASITPLDGSLAPERPTASELVFVDSLVKKLN